MIEDYTIESTRKTPSIKCNAASGTITMNGNCIPEDAVGFFKPLKDWIDIYVKSAPQKTELKIELNYFNTSTSRILLNLFRLFEGLKEEGKEFKILWIFEEDDLDMKEAGEDYQLMMNDLLILCPTPI
jgi:hypothetical protein